MRMKYYAKLWLRYMRIGFLCMTQYPADTMIWFISMIIREACGFVGILAVAGVTGHLGDWGIYEICLLFSMCAVIEAMGQAFFDNVWAIDKMIRRGEMDTFLVRPASPFIQMLGQVMHFQAILSMAVYVGILVWSIRGIGLSIGVREIILLIEYIICGTMINSGIYTIFNTLNFWIVYPAAWVCGILPGPGASWEDTDAGDDFAAVCGCADGGDCISTLANGAQGI